MAGLFYMIEHPQHKDKLDQSLSIGDCVAFPHHNGLEIGIIVKIHPKMVKVKKIEPPKRCEAPTYNKYAKDMVKIEGPLVSMYIIKKSGGK